MAAEKYDPEADEDGDKVKVALIVSVVGLRLGNSVEILEICHDSAAFGAWWLIILTLISLDGTPYLEHMLRRHLIRVFTVCFILD